MRAAALLPGFAAWSALAFGGAAWAEDKKDPGPTVTAIAPLEVVPGEKVTIRLRGLHLDQALEIRFTDATPPISVELKEKKKAEVPNGLEAKDVGDTQVEANLVVPEALPPGKVHFTVATPEGKTAPSELRVASAGSLVEEKKPDDGFRTAQPLEFGKTFRGLLKEDKDVAVVQFAGHAGRRLVAAVRAAQLGSLLDPVLTLFDARRNVVASCDDTAGSRDPRIEHVLPEDGCYYLSIQDAQDRGGPWHCFELEITEAEK